MTERSEAYPWEKLGAVAPLALSDARLEVHWAAQLLASFGQALVEPRRDDSHRAMTWDPDRRAFVGEPAAVDPTLRVSLRPAGLLISLNGKGDAPLASTALTDRTLEAAYTWLAEAAGAALGRAPIEFEPPEYEIPDHPVGHGERFPVETGPAEEELARWFGNAYGVLAAFAARTETASPVRIWPHHFDIATLISLDPELDPQTGRSVGVGLSPGDDGVAEPYWYVNAWPRPDVRERELPPLPGGGVWNTKGWFGAVLRGNSVIELGEADLQRTLVEQFIEEAVRVCRDLLSR